MKIEKPVSRPASENHKPAREAAGNKRLPVVFPGEPTASTDGPGGPTDMDDFDEEDFDDEFDDDFEEELEDEYELSEFADVTDEDLAEDDEADCGVIGGDFVDEDEEPADPAAADPDAAADEEDE